MPHLHALGTRLTCFSAGTDGQWRINSIKPVRGEPLAVASHLRLHHEPDSTPCETVWSLAGVSSNTRYVERAEKTRLVEVQAGLNRPEATCAALIPIRKSAAWWDLTQEERRAIFEAKSQHIAASMKYLPAIARQLHHSRDIGEPFDFLTWFEYAPAHASDFEELVAMLRATEEWRYVEREVDIRLQRA